MHCAIHTQSRHITSAPITPTHHKKKNTGCTGSVYELYPPIWITGSKAVQTTPYHTTHPKVHSHAATPDWTADRAAVSDTHTPVESHSQECALSMPHNKRPPYRQPMHTRIRAGPQTPATAQVGCCCRCLCTRRTVGFVGTKAQQHSRSLGVHPGAQAATQTAHCSQN